MHCEHNLRWKNGYEYELITKDESIIIEENKPHGETERHFILLKEEYMYMN